MIPVTQTFLPPIEEYRVLLQRAWDKKWITNRGELVQELEKKLKSYLNINNIILTSNGTLPLQIAIKAMGLKGEIITSPFSYIATTSSIIWENCTPVFVDISPEYLTIDETKIEEAITRTTTAILVTHVFGNPCNIDRIESIAKKYSLKTIYDGAHCFGVNYKEKSVFDYGDISTCSFHATKLFHTGEGGAMFCNNEELNHKLFYSHNFGHNGQYDYYGLGINAKISELQAAMGLAILPYMNEIINERKNLVNLYEQCLNKTSVQFMKLRSNTNWNYSYFPIIFESEKQMFASLKHLNELKVFPRRYFYPSLNTIEYTNGQVMPVSESISTRILCLPLYVGLTHENIDLISQTINKHTL